MVLAFELVLTRGVILYIIYYILYYYYILSYTILFSPSLPSSSPSLLPLFSSPLSNPSLPLLFYHSSSFSFPPQSISLSHPHLPSFILISFILYVSVFIVRYLYLLDVYLLFFSSLLLLQSSSSLSSPLPLIYLPILSFILYVSMVSYSYLYSQHQSTF